MRYKMKRKELRIEKLLGFDCFGGTIPDESSICRFRHLLEKHNISDKILEIINTHLDMHGLILRSGTIVDATLLQAPVSKKNKAKSRDPEMSSTRKNNKWYFGAKGHIGVQASGKLGLMGFVMASVIRADENTHYHIRKRRKTASINSTPCDGRPPQLLFCSVIP